MSYFKPLHFPLMNRHHSVLRASLLLIVASFLTSACAEVAGSGTPGDIPEVVIDCQSAKCKQTESPRIFVYITASSCDFNFLAGAEAAISTDAITCNPTTGCFGSISGPWIGRDNTNTTTVGSGAYTVCSYISYDRFVPGPAVDLTKAELFSVVITSDRGPIRIENVWSDL